MMDTVLSLLVLSALPHLVVPQDPRTTSFRAKVEIVSGTSRIFSEEKLQLRCSIPEDYNVTWTFRWFRGSDLLPQTGQIFKLWKANIKESGKYSCQGIWDTVVGNIKTQPSLPVEISVDGGWAILDVPPEPGLVGDTLKLTCRIRQDFPVHESILYRDGIEVMRQKGPNLHLFLTNVTLKDNGMYSCRVSFDVHLRTYSVMSVATPVHVLDVLSQPVLEIITEDIFIRKDKMKLICHVQYNARAPAPPIHYYFYRDNSQLGTATSESHSMVKRTPGHYSCRAKVPQLGLWRWSEPKPFGKVTGLPMPPPRPQPRSHFPLSPPKFSREHVLPPEAQPAQPPISSTAASFGWPVEDASQSSESSLETSLPVSSDMASSTQMSSDQTPTQMSSDQIPTQMSPDQTPTQMSSDQTPTQMSSDQTPTQMSSDQIPTQMSSDQTPTQMSSDQIPTQMSSDQIPTQMSSDQTPTQMSSDQTSTQMSSDQASSKSLV